MPRETVYSGGRTVSYRQNPQRQEQKGDHEAEKWKQERSRRNSSEMRPWHSGLGEFPITEGLPGPSAPETHTEPHAQSHVCLDYMLCCDFVYAGSTSSDMAKGFPLSEKTETGVSE